MKLLVIRPQPGADATAARVRAAGHEAVMLPLFDMQPVDWEMQADKAYDALLITSANAIRLAGKKREQLIHLPVFAVGQNSAHAARAHGFSVEFAGNDGIREILPYIQRHKILWLAGNDRTEFEMSDMLDIDIQIVYRSVALPLPESFAETVLDMDYVMLHSARAALFFSELVTAQKMDKKQISIAAFSQKIAFAAGSGWNKVYVARHPSDEHLLSEL